MYIARSKSYDTIIRFLTSFLCNEDPEDHITTLATDQHDYLMHQPDAAFPVKGGENASTAPPLEIFAQRYLSCGIYALITVDTLRCLCKFFVRY
jgi:hypothetical protein